MNLEQHTVSKTVAAIYEHYQEARKGGHRHHLGGSQIGNPCERALWYQFRWADSPLFDGRQLRLFETGDREEARLVANLRAIGCTVWAVDPDTGRQISFTACDGHFALSLDGVIEGLPDAPKTVHTFEAKTMNDKNFASLKKDGVEKSKPIYWAQCQIGMHMSGIERCAFVAVCKSTDEIYLERIHYDAAFAIGLIAKAERVVFSDKPPAKLSNDPAFFGCKFCDYRDVCHNAKPPEINCRTCAHSTPERGGDRAWSCAAGKKFGKPCESHLFNPYGMGWQVHDAGADWVEYQTTEGEIVRNEAGKSLEFAAKWVPF
jgi:hypothetical protein